MKILVCIKRVVDANVKVRVKPDNSDVDIQFSKMSLNPFDENAVEEAVRLKEQQLATSVVAVSIGEDKCADTLRSAMAHGCDRAILIKTNLRFEPIGIATILRYLVEKEKPDLILLGKQAIDDDSNQVGQMLAGMLDYPQGTFVSKLEVLDNSILVEREIDNGTEKLEIMLPAIVTTDLQLNEPRFITLPQLMQAKKKLIEMIDLEDLCVPPQPSVELISVVDGETRKQCKFLTNIDEVLQILKTGKVI